MVGSPLIDSQGTVDDASLTMTGLMAMSYNSKLRVKKMTTYAKNAMKQDPEVRKLHKRAHACSDLHAHDHVCTCPQKFKKYTGVYMCTCICMHAHHYTQG